MLGPEPDSLEVTEDTAEVDLVLFVIFVVLVTTLPEAAN
jgi:hypothetical protein